jgi:hypothetical protein
MSVAGVDPGNFDLRKCELSQNAGRSPVKPANTLYSSDQYMNPEIELYEVSRFMVI